MDYINQLKEMIAGANDIVFFGGAGVSTESGIPDFRSKDGLYNQEYEYEPEYILSTECFEYEPEVFWKFYREKILIEGAKPNDAHKALAKLEQDGKCKAIVTQNIDNLHEMAGSKNVYHIHGTIMTNHCPFCGKEYSLEQIKNRAMVPKCRCLSTEPDGFVIKPDVTLYGEPLPKEAWVNSVRAIQKADMLIIAGTSLQVNPAASLAQYFAGDSLVIINMDSTKMDKNADLVIHEKVGEVLRKAILEN